MPGQPRFSRRDAIITMGAAPVAVGLTAETSTTPAVAHTPGHHSGRFQQPLVPGISADPSILVHEGMYHLLYNKQNFWSKITLRMADSLQGLYFAPDLEIVDNSQLPKNVQVNIGMGARLLPWRNKFYLYSTGRPAGSGAANSFVMESEGPDPRGPYTWKATFPAPLGNNGYAFACAPHWIGDKLHATYSEDGRVYLARLSNPWTVSSRWAQVVSDPDHPWEVHGKAWNEGGAITVHDGRVYLIYSASWFTKSDYCVGMSSASLHSDLLDPKSWTKTEHPVFSRRDSVGAYGPGSMVFFTSPSESEIWVVYHIKTTDPGAGAHRQLQARKVEWTRKGTPDFGSPDPRHGWRELPDGDPGTGYLEAEDGTVHGGRVARSDSASGGSYVAGLDRPGNYVEIPLRVASAGTYPVRIWYKAHGGGPDTQQLTVSGSTPVTVRYPDGGDPDTFPADRFVTAGLELPAGKSKLRLTADQGTVDLDRLAVDTRTTSAGLAIAAIDDSNVDIVARVDRKLTIRSWSADSGKWSPWKAIPRSVPGGGAAGWPAAVSRPGSGELAVFVQSVDGTLYFATRTASGWSAWHGLGSPGPGIAISGLCAASRGKPNIDVYVMGADNEVWGTATSDSGKTWIKWHVPADDELQYPALPVAAAPTAVSRHKLWIDMLVTRIDGHIWGAHWDGSDGSWNGWQAVGSPFGGATSAPAVTSTGEQELQILVRGSDGNLWTSDYANETWGDWKSLPHGSLSWPAASAPATTASAGTVRVAVYDRDGHVGVIRRTSGSSPSSSWSAWTDLGVPSA